MWQQISFQSIFYKEKITRYFYKVVLYKDEYTAFSNSKFIITQNSGITYYYPRDYIGAIYYDDITEDYYTTVKNEKSFYKTYEIETPLNINDQIIINNEKFIIKQKFHYDNGDIKYVIDNKNNLIKDKESWKKIKDQYNVLCNEEDEKKIKKEEKIELIVEETVNSKEVLPDNKIVKFLRRFFYFKK
jgi:hypothetical protein